MDEVFDPVDNEAIVTVVANAVAVQYFLVIACMCSLHRGYSLGFQNDRLQQDIDSWGWKLMSMNFALEAAEQEPYLCFPKIGGDAIDVWNALDALLRNVDYFGPIDSPKDRQGQKRTLMVETAEIGEYWQQGMLATVAIALMTGEGVKYWTLLRHSLKNYFPWQKRMDLLTHLA